MQTERELGTFGAVNLEACVAVEAIPQQRGLPVVRVDVQPAQGQRAVCLRRHKIVIDPNCGRAKGHEVVTCVGWANCDGGEYTFIFADGRKLVTSDFQAV